MSKISQLILKSIFIIMIPFIMVGGCQALLFGHYIGGVASIVQPLTKPTRLVFVDDSTGKPLGGLKVLFLWQASNGGEGGGGGWVYHREEIVIRNDGSVRLPRQWKPFPIVLYPFWVRGHTGIFMSFRSWEYEQEDCFDTGHGCASMPFQIRGDETERTIRLKPAVDLDSKLNVLSHTTFFGKEYWEEGVTAIVQKYGINPIGTQQLALLADTCAEFKSSICEEFNKKLLDRNKNIGDAHWSRKAALRLGIVTPAMVNYMKEIETKLKNEEPTSIEEDNEAKAIRQVVDKQKISVKALK